MFKAMDESILDAAWQRDLSRKITNNVRLSLKKISSLTRLVKCHESSAERWDSPYVLEKEHSVRES
jgi:hypothetical protein